MTDRAHQRSSALTLLWSLFAAALGVWWTIDTSAFPFGANDTRPGGGSLLAGLDVRFGATAVLVLGVVGIVAALALRRGAGRPVAWLGGFYAVLFGLFVPDMQVLILVGYLFAFAAPLALVTMLVAGALRSFRRAVVVIGGLAVLGSIAWWSGILDGTAVSALLNAESAPENQLSVRPLHMVFFLVGGLVWGWAAVVGFRAGKGRCGSCGRPGARWTEPDAAARWGKYVTIAAALCPLPYGLLRMSWLTPAPVLGPGNVAESPGIRLMGLLLGFAAIGGSVLTLGLIQRWGEIWPRWVPVLRGRPVPIAFPVTFGALIAAVMAFAAVSFGIMSLSGPNPQPLMLLVFPFPLWAPLLAAAVLAHYYRRRPACRHHAVAADR
ncbi:hypothetical protein [Allokutzneria albata]|uniref:Uncharacterized protein n=1 Tax=Allokutzneria albata TaxID=211114 RepID=A0A1H0AD00_ALLAB|nr:hypothetical protein [Allokutzneria albata]SDN31449.1 hypothetical protein SAMN04489726_6009 [Allokutzneria albata]